MAHTHTELATVLAVVLHTHTYTLLFVDTVVRPRRANIYRQRTSAGLIEKSFCCYSCYCWQSCSVRDKTTLPSWSSGFLFSIPLRRCPTRLIRRVAVRQYSRLSNRAAITRLPHYGPVRVALGKKYTGDAKCTEQSKKACSSLPLQKPHCKRTEQKRTCQKFGHTHSPECRS